MRYPLSVSSYSSLTSWLRFALSGQTYFCFLWDILLSFMCAHKAKGGLHILSKLAFPSFFAPIILMFWDFLADTEQGDTTPHLLA